jgi:hypothetical protein
MLDRKNIGRIGATLIALLAMLANGAYGDEVQTQNLLTLAPTLKPALMLDDGPIINPADRRPESPTTQPSAARVPNWELPPITVIGQPSLRAEDRVGSYAQPRWTVDRRFPGTRVYVIPEGTVEFEYWFRADIARKGPSETQHFFELEFGLPYRFQLDLYGIVRSEEQENFVDNQVELRWALADWGKIWGNPTLYAEYVNKDQDPDKIEFKLLLGDELASRWHWGQNLLFEGETGGRREYEYGWSGGLSYTVIDSKLDVGVEAQLSFFDVHGDRGTYTHEIFLGPSIQYRPSARIHLNFAPLIGVGHESPAAKLLFNFGYEF